MMPLNLFMYAASAAAAYSAFNMGLASFSDASGGLLQLSVC
jgi:hypothetical protein